MAKNDGKIYITISDTRGGTGGPGTNPNVSPDSKKEKEDKNPLGDYAKHQFFNLVTNQAKQAVNYSISNIGNFTGDYMKQEHIQNMMQAGSFVYGLVMSTIAGAKIAGPWGAVIAVAATTISEAVSTGQQYYAGLVANARQNRDIALLRERAGLNGANNGSRGTDQ